MAGNAGMGRPKGALNKRTSALVALVEAGESPAAFGLRIMRDETQPLDVRLNAARLIAPLVHARPSPAGETVAISLPDASTPDCIVEASGAILRAVAEGELAVSTGKDLMDMLDSHRRGLELTVIKGRLQALEAASGKS
jgi:hypothetical protein